jgi:hypothetical protein
MRRTARMSGKVYGQKRRSPRVPASGASSVVLDSDMEHTLYDILVQSHATKSRVTLPPLLRKYL